MEEFVITISEAAEFDLDLAFSWYELQRAGLGGRFISSIRNKIDAINIYPHSFPLFHKNIYRAILNDFPYGIYYQINEANKELRIIAILHFKQNSSGIIKNR